ncbi:hypothetical protein H112_07967 [Trichophyton rubrum D6]|uniref:Uncharacterized protein n=3 Tax=Trichophyton TaxID=5550 RepID=A0A080WDW2_TRIRC|nr:uncharacterized protein TERG_11588 [Trichophyton rubrum CBS 118892]EZF10757.1 hypothetical protein H100_07995 [Trichophyton rubrum MR850]EZF37654.1 hypothetical protein H102_07955 [Trichophyton rubrum CBS 100081]EZF48333.1 hypothetical protein H103_07979 [Trichophyton rubrum CBS 288.86]EZF58923.1 hypothetical protein H104_07926 [Trichophyton rubrum CBS 289.86]EZF69521.1 hypothetical protein H105_07978 [Trichophyton soudanense CBS 452.61]EZF80211.1 hypothetical protein H110_07978 [Trichophy
MFSIYGNKIGGAAYTRLARISQATARRSWRSESQSSTSAWILNHRTQTSRQKTTQARYCSPPASLAVWITSLVITVLLAFVTRPSSSSQQTTCSTRCLSRRATFVTSFAGRAGVIIWSRVRGSTISSIRRC